MEFTDLIGFFVILLVFLIPLLKKLLVDKKKVEEEEEIVIEEEPPPAPIKASTRTTTERLVKKDFTFHSEVGEREFESRIEDRELVHQEAPEFKERIVSDAFILETASAVREENPIATLTKKYDPVQAMVVLSEIIGKPKGLS